MDTENGHALVRFIINEETTVFPHIVSGNYSFLNLEIQRSQYIRPKVTVHKCAETIQGRKLFKGKKYMRKYGIQITRILFDDI